MSTKKGSTVKSLPDDAFFAKHAQELQDLLALREKVQRHLGWMHWHTKTPVEHPLDGSEVYLLEAFNLGIKHAIRGCDADGKPIHPLNPLNR